MKKTMIVSSLIIFAFAMVMNLQWAVKDGYGVKDKALHAQVLGQLNASGSGTCHYYVLNLGNTGSYTNPYTNGAKIKASNTFAYDSNFSISYNIYSQTATATYSQSGVKSVVKIEYRCGWDFSGRCDLSLERDVVML